MRPDESEPFFEALRRDLDRPHIRRALQRGLIAVGVVGLLIVAMASVPPALDYLWYVHDVRAPQVFLVAMQTRFLLLLAGLVLATLTLRANLGRAFDHSLVYFRPPDDLGRLFLANAMEWVTRQGRRIVAIGSPILGLFLALGLANQGPALLLALNARSFGRRDPLFGLDAGFYVFQLPFWEGFIGWLFSLAALATLASVGIYAGLQALASMARIELASPQVRRHIGKLLALCYALLAARLALGLFDAPLSEGAQFTGAGYAASQAVWLQAALAALTLVVAGLTLRNAFVGEPYRAPIAGGIGLAAFYLLVVVGYPSLIQRLFVDNDLNKETPYAARAIAMTRFAYGLDRIDLRDTPAATEPTSAEVARNADVLDNLRLWDPEVVQEVFEGIQGIRPYYTFHDVDVDRYPIGGRSTLVMLAPRDVALGGLDPNARNWTNERLRYTHGYGLVAARVEAATPEGGPAFLASDIPQRAQLPIAEPRIYFSDTRDRLRIPTDEWALVNARESEFDYPTETGTASHRWAGDRGIPVGNFLNRIVASIALADGDLLVSGNVQAGTRLLMHRNVLARAARVFPFLRFDDDPYLVLHEGRPVWILDAYTVTDRVPYSAHLSTRRMRLNYVRNSVKATVDAYTGEVRGYLWDANDPLIQAYSAIYPRLLRPASEVPPGLRAHFRYPEDLLGMQSTVLSTYHVTDPRLFLTGGDAWQIANERGLQGQRTPIRPYYVQLRLPNPGAETGFHLILPFTPRGKTNMSAWLAAGCDPNDYGRLTLYRFTSGPPIAGPEQMEALFQANPEVSFINRQYNNAQSEIVVGNLLVLPVGQSVLYAEALFLRGKTVGAPSVPRLFRVILAVNGRIVVGETYTEALQKLFGARTTTPEVPAPPAGSTPTPPPTGAEREALREALKLLDDADAALRRGDFAAYGERLRALRRRLSEGAGAEPAR